MFTTAQRQAAEDLTKAYDNRKLWTHITAAEYQRLSAAHYLLAIDARLAIVSGQNTVRNRALIVTHTRRGRWFHIASLVERGLHRVALYPTPSKYGALWRAKRKRDNGNDD